MKNLWMKMVIGAVFTLVVLVAGEVKTDAATLVSRTQPSIIKVQGYVACLPGYTCTYTAGMTVMTKGKDWFLYYYFFR